MGDYTGTTTVTTDPGTAFCYISDVSNLPHYFSRMTSVQDCAGNEIHATARMPDGREVEADAWFRVDPATHRVEWGSEGPSGYSGYLDVRPGGVGAEIEVHLHTERVGGDDKRVSEGIQDTLATLKRCIEDDGRQAARAAS